MVSQMVSLNQLDQLISINQTLSNLTGGSAATSGSGTGSGTGSETQGSVAGGPAGVTTNGASAPGAANTLAPMQQPIYNPALPPGALMNLYGNMGAPVNYSNVATPGGR
jgi:hypothetical protein